MNKLYAIVCVYTKKYKALRSGQVCYMYIQKVNKIEETYSTIKEKKVRTEGERMKYEINLCKHWNKTWLINR